MNIELTLKGGKAETIKAKEVKQNILPQYTFFVHKSYDIEKCYVITEESTGCAAYTHVGKLKDCVSDFLKILESNKQLYIKAIERMKVKTVKEHQIKLF